MTLLTKALHVRALCTKLAKEDFVTVDTEFIREKTYWPDLCLIQVAGENEAAAIDPLTADMDLTPVWELMQNPTVVKVFHAARQDIEIFVHLTGKTPTPVYDTQIAAMVCGFGDQVGYESLVQKLAKARIDKASRFTDWAARPLSHKQLSYALSDVTHLRTAYRKLRRQIQSEKREAWIAEEMATLEDISTYVKKPEEAWQRIKSRSLKPKHLAVLKEVAAWRESLARQKNIPKNRIFRDETLLDIVSNAPKTVAELSRARGVSKRLAEGPGGQEILKAIRRGVNASTTEVPTAPKREKLPPRVAPVVEFLKVLLKDRCERSNVAQKLVASMADLERIATDDEAAVPALSGWRRDLFGADAIALKKGDLALAVRNGGVETICLDRTSGPPATAPGATFRPSR
ncbi:MAG: ribonuclease D [Rhodospirillaceae bacterium]|nr:ribonuclease D [Rhodospirillaceae bacterium]